MLSSKKGVHMVCEEFKFLQSTVKFGTHFLLRCEDDVKVDGTISEEYSSECAKAGCVRRSSRLMIESLGAVTVSGSLNSEFVYLLSNSSINVEGSVKSQRSDCLVETMFVDTVTATTKA